MWAQPSQMHKTPERASSGARAQRGLTWHPSHLRVHKDPSDRNVCLALEGHQLQEREHFIVYSWKWPQRIISKFLEKSSDESEVTHLAEGRAQAVLRPSPALWLSHPPL